MEASRGLVRQELERTERSNRRLRRLSMALAILLGLVLAGGGEAWRQSQLAQAQADRAVAGQLESQAESLLNVRPDLAILAGLQSMSTGRAQQRFPPPGLVAGLSRITHPVRILPGGDDPLLGVAFSPDGWLLASGSATRRCGCGTPPPANRRAHR